MTELNLHYKNNPRPIKREEKPQNKCIIALNSAINLKFKVDNQRRYLAGGSGRKMGRLRCS